MIRSWRYLCPTIGALALLGAACGGGGDDLGEALQALSENDLAIMVLPEDELGGEIAGLEIDADESGFSDSADTADDTLDPEDTADDIDRMGRVSGYGLGYSDPDLSALAEGEGVVFAGTSLDLFQDEEGAAAFLDKQLDDYQRFEGKEVEPGFRLEQSETFTVDGLGDEAVGLRAQLTFGDATAFQTVVAFRLGRLLAAAVLSRADDTDAAAQMEETARALEARVEGVLRGEIRGTPVPIPAKEEERTVPPPEEGPDLAAMALSLDDLPEGVSIEREGYVPDENTVASYEREFDLGTADIGGSRLIGLENDVDFYGSDPEATGVFAGIKAIFTSESAADFFGSFFEEGAGFEATDVQVEQARIARLGEESAAIHASTDTPLGDFEYVFVFVRIDRSLGSLILTAVQGELDPADAERLAQAMTDRMEETLAAGR